MAIKNSRYKIKNGSIFDVYHFESNARSIKLLNSSKAELGNIEELIFKGKVVNGGSINDIKLSGYYQITNVTGLPTGFNNTVPAFLKVVAIGNVGEPTTIMYELVDRDGNINHAIKNGSTLSSWTNGGKSLASSVDSIKSLLGNSSNIPQALGASTTQAIGKLHENSINLSENVESLKRSFNTHKHDEVYLKTQGVSELSGTVNLKSGSKIGLLTVNGTSINLIRPSANQIEIGNTDTNLNLFGRGDLIFNGKKVVTIGSDSTGINAEKLNGVASSQYVRKDVAQTIEQPFTFNSYLRTNLIQPRDSSQPLRISHDSNYIELRSNQFETPRIFLRGNEETPSSITMSSNKGEIYAMYNHNNHGGFYFDNQNMRRNIFKVDMNDNVVKFDREIQTQGRKLYIQPNVPAGKNHPVGSVWIGG